ncbi:uncharacterized protein LAESUDRAFT_222394 [Laetiporus sulphureus 93-53]|uniref:Uncharacterized protein n=1 Tax=Laetiporus sulphureus 93-53 TaxID=1314785 RepID=A0A165DTJ3_9APHY|nr:uncharacterized protein LAESUDRAFT_222394 [Laetiporus sulphureus 93-53]KZT05603.1 hypothetical protein LAESUDRAFT_222394 [Laetiporus sulphureus 93-53]
MHRRFSSWILSCSHAGMGILKYAAICRLCCMPCIYLSRQYTLLSFDDAHVRIMSVSGLCTTNELMFWRLS